MLTNGVAGGIVDRLGFAGAFVVLSGFALAELAQFVTAVPETKLPPRPTGWRVPG